jgi:hypothetical protein
MAVLFCLVVSVCPNREVSRDPSGFVTLAQWDRHDPLGKADRVDPCPAVGCVEERFRNFPKLFGVHFGLTLTKYLPSGTFVGVI